MPDIAKTLDGLPGWAIPATIGGVVLLALFQHKSGSSGGNVGNVTTLAPTPIDPGAVAISTSETNARENVLTELIRMLGSEEISTISARRDVEISGINASVANRRTAASEAVGIAQTDAQTKISLANATAAADINRTNVAGATSRAHIEAKSKLGDTLINGAKAIAHLFGF